VSIPSNLSGIAYLEYPRGKISTTFSRLVREFI
jgi:hypothetical protein